MVRLSPWTVGLLPLLGWLSGLGGIVDRPTLALPPPAVVAQLPLGGVVLYVNPAAGSDTPGAGTATTPFRSITYALQQAAPGTVVRLERGSYTQQTGENFPLVLPTGVTLLGDSSSKGQVVAIIGGGTIVSPTFARQNVTILAGKDSEIRGVAVTNPNVRGTGVWVESVSPTIKDCTFSNNHREGVFVTGTGNPKIEQNVFTQNGGNGISTTGNSRGEIRENLFKNTGFGLAIGGSSAPLVSSNQVIENTDGIYINDSARPVLRNNLIENNKRDGIVATTKSYPDLGTEANAGNNTLRGNRQYDLHNTTSETLYSVGNRLDPNRVLGKIVFSGSPGAAIAFRDVQGHWAQNYIAALAQRNIISGFPDGSFRPSQPVTRAQFAAIVSKAFTPTARQTQREFRDVASNFWGYQAIQTTVQAGFMTGYPEGTFRPDRPIPRVEVLVALTSGLGFDSGRLENLSRYQDATQIPVWATGAIAAATQRQIVVNYPTLTQLAPARNATRAEVAAFIYQALVHAGKADAIPSPYVVSGN